MAALLLGVPLLLAGCQAPDEEVSTPKASNVPFEGKPDPSLAATYKTKDGTVYVLSADGAFHFDGKTSTPKGVLPTHGEGYWAVNNGQLLFKDVHGVVPYLYLLKGKDLILSLTGKMKNETVFIRQ